jgi:probable phosphoglycerate mutase
VAEPGRPARLVFVRHGESVANVRRVISNRDLDHGLTPRGLEQARALASGLAGAGLSRVCSSPIPRAAQTARVVADALGLAVWLHDGLREPDCGWAEGRGDEAAWAEHDRAVRAWNKGDLDARAGGGESLREVRARLAAFLERAPAGDALVVTHGRLLLDGLAPLLGLDPGWVAAAGAPHGSPVVVELRAGGPACVSWCGLEPDA